MRRICAGTKCAIRATSTLRNMPVTGDGRNRMVVRMGGRPSKSWYLHTSLKSHEWLARKEYVL